MNEILLIEDDLALRRCIEDFLTQHGLLVTAFYEGMPAFRYFKDHGASILVVDIRLNDMNGISLLRELTTAFPVHPPVILITGHGDKALAIEALRLGAFDFLEKPFEPDTLLASIQRAIAAKKKDVLDFQFIRRESESSSLTQRESQILSLIEEGLQNREIAARLEIAPETVKFHLKSIFRKLQISNRFQLLSLKRKA